MVTTDPLSTRERLLESTYQCVARYGMSKTTMDDVVGESGLSRATVYRHFPGGRDELLRSTVGWELARFFTRLADEVRGAATLAEMLEHGLVFARQQVQAHDVLNKMLETEPERLLPLLTVEAQRTLPFIASFLMPYLQREQAAGRMASGRDLERAADYLARAILSLIGEPGRFDLSDAEVVSDVVAYELLGGLSRDAG